MPRVIPCAGCAKPIMTGKGSLPPGEATCRMCRATQSTRGEQSANCAQCGHAFASVRSRGSWTRCCSKSCAQLLRLGEAGKPPGRDPAKRRASYQAKNHRRRAKLHDVASEPYDTAEIAERDGHRCGLCRRRVDMTLRRPDPLSASIDHIVPLSKGGDDMRANIQLAHLRCNIRKSNAVQYAQPLLFG